MADRVDPAGSLTYDPVADVAARYPDWRVGHVDLGGFVSEVLCWARRVILLEVTDRAEVSRSSLAHAIAHLDLGHAATISRHFESREERQADRLAASRLIPLPALESAMSWSLEPGDIAAQLGVDLEMLQVRERALTLGERRRLAESLDVELQPRVREELLGLHDQQLP